MLSEVRRWVDAGIKTRYKSEANIETHVKDYIRNQFKNDSIKDSDYEGFAVLLDKLVELLSESRCNIKR